MNYKEKTFELLVLEVSIQLFGQLLKPVAQSKTAYLVEPDGT